MKIVKSLENSSLSIKGVVETIENEKKKEQRGRFIGMPLDTLGASTLWNMSAGKGFVWAAEGTTTAKEQGKIGAGHNF